MMSVHPLSNSDMPTGLSLDTPVTVNHGSLFNKYNHVMIDLETVGTSPGCAIVSLGAVAFNLLDGEMSPHVFYGVVRRSTCLRAGLAEDPRTVAWWSSQKYEARAEYDRSMFAGQSTPLPEVLYNFVQFLQDHTTAFSEDSTERRLFNIWSNGAGFDLPILTAAYTACGWDDAPWPAFSDRCYRTIKNLPGAPPMVRQPGTAHHALEDAMAQAGHLVQIYAHLGLYAPQAKQEN